MRPEGLLMTSGNEDWLRPVARWLPLLLGHVARRRLWLLLLLGFVARRLLQPIRRPGASFINRAYKRVLILPYE